MSKLSVATILVLPLVFVMGCGEGEGVGQSKSGLVTITPIADGLLPARPRLGNSRKRIDKISLERQQWISTSTITLDPGDAVPYHTHPGIGVLTVISGTATFEHTDGSRFSYQPGQSLLEGPVLHSLVNCGDTPMTLQGTFFIPCDTIACKDLIIWDTSGRAPASCP